MKFDIAQWLAHNKQQLPFKEFIISMSTNPISTFYTIDFYSAN